jgi:polysaccharide deacetylase 2 family uncharacterized protein YibQ
VRLQLQAHAAAPQVAVLSEVSPVRPIDYALGYREERAEAAFFEGLEQPASLGADAALDVALALPADQKGVEVDAPESLPAEKTRDIVFSDDLKLARYIQPRPVRFVAVLVPLVNLDTDFTPDTSDTPPSEDVVDIVDDLLDVVEAPVEEIEEAEEVVVAEVAVREIMTAPPRATPLPSLRKRTANEAQLVSFERESDTEFGLPNDDELISEPIASAEIEEADLPPLDVADKANTDRPTPARDVPKITNGPRIALVIAAAGLNENVTRFAIDALPAGVTLAFAPVKAQARALAQDAKHDGHTVLVEIPMEPLNRSRDPGPLTLRVGNSSAQNLSNLDKALALIPSADGASSYLGARFNADERAAAPVIASLANRGLFFFENEPTSRSVFQGLAARNSVPYARGVLKFDRDRSGSSIRSELDRLERQARQRGYAVGVGTTLRGTVSTVALWAKEAEKRGVRLVPITEIGKK